jgi:hypothetical protein
VRGKRELLRPTPVLDLKLGLQRFIARGKFLRPNEPHGQTRECVTNTLTRLMLRQPALKVIRVPRVD